MTSNSSATDGETSATVPTALITGAARRIGAVTARRLHADGHAVIIHYRSSADDAIELCASLNRLRPGSAFAEQCDFADTGEIDSLVRRITEKHRRLDVLVNNASAFFPTPLGQITPTQIEKLFASNFVAPLLLTQAFLPLLQNHHRLRAGQGVVINMIDIHAKRPYRDHTVYCAAKAALAMQTRSLALELAPAVRVNGVAPGSILWPSVSGQATSEDSGISAQQQQAILNGIPMQRNGTPEEIARTISWLASSASSYITGQIIAVDGGRSL